MRVPVEERKDNKLKDTEEKVTNLLGSVDQDRKALCPAVPMVCRCYESTS